MKRWEKNLCGADFAPTKYSRICSLHFTEADFQSERADTNECRKSSRGGLWSRRLKLTAEPTIFVDLPSLQRPPVDGLAMLSLIRGAEWRRSATRKLWRNFLKETYFLLMFPSSSL
ncbi:MAG: THAP domain-containing protein [Gammaproteobacteria bacterium]|nr:THAP domain-containing protein [Gammaproteobacteria bacterium]